MVSVKGTEIILVRTFIPGRIVSHRQPGHVIQVKVCHQFAVSRLVLLCAVCELTAYQTGKPPHLTHSADLIVLVRVECRLVEVSD